MSEIIINGNVMFKGGDSECSAHAQWYISVMHNLNMYTCDCIIVHDGTGMYVYARKGRKLLLTIKHSREVERWYTPCPPNASHRGKIEMNPYF